MCEQLDAIGIGSLTVVFLTGTFTGMVLALQSGLTLDQFGARPVVGRLVSASMVKELGPVLTALMVTGRVGSGIAAELGSMMVTDQIAALRALGTDPIRKLVVPRVIAGTVMVPILTILADALGIFGGVIISKFQLGVAYSVYWNNVVRPGNHLDSVVDTRQVPTAPTSQFIPGFVGDAPLPRLVETDLFVYGFSLGVWIGF